MYAATIQSEILILAQKMSNVLCLLHSVQIFMLGTAGLLFKFKQCTFSKIVVALGVFYLIQGSAVPVA